MAALCCGIVHDVSGSAMRLVARLAIPALASVLLASCGGDDPILPGPDTGPLTAFIDGDPFVAEFASVTRDGAQVWVNANASGGPEITMRFPDSGPTNHFIGPGNEVSVVVTIDASIWIAGGATGSGTITVTAVTSNYIEGSFSLTVEGGPSHTSLSVTNGRFLIDLF